jgi:tetratricopeptide (TPR) repeat protein
MTSYAIPEEVGRLIARSALIVMLAADPAATQAGADPPEVGSCPRDARFPDVDELGAALARDEHAVDPRLKLVDSLLAHGCYAEAVSVLERGQSLHPGNKEIQSRLRNARSMLSEQHYFVGLDRAAQTAQFERNLLRCRKLADIAACDGALADRPNDAGIVTAKADALMESGRPADALLVYRQVAELDPASSDVEKKVAAAESQRQTLLSQCQHDSPEVALRACQAALLRGASDEFSIYQRKGILLQSIDQPSQALDSYIAASALKKDDEAVSLAIVALTESTGRKDALALAARGHALLTLNRASEAVQAFLQARALVPDLPGIDAPLAAARELAQRAERQTALAHAEPAPELAVSAPATSGPNSLETAAVGAGVVEKIPSAMEERRMYSNNSPATRSN